MYRKDEVASDTRCGCYGCTACLSTLGLILILILVPLSYSKIEYYEGGLLEQRSTSQVDKNKVYRSGNHYVGPDYTFEKFEISFQNFNQRLSVFSKVSADDAGSSLFIDVSFQYELRSKDLGDLYKLVALNYESLIETNAIDAIKNTAPLFSIDEFISMREFIEEIFQKNVSKAIDPVFADVKALQLRDIITTDEYQESRLEAAIQEESNLKEDYVQEATLVRENTQTEVTKIENDALNVEAEAKAKATVTEESANSEAIRLVNDATTNGLLHMFQELNLTNPEFRQELDYIVTLILSASDNKYYLDFDTLSTQLSLH